jgi:hypothetical protein
MIRADSSVRTHDRPRTPPGGEGDTIPLPLPPDAAFADDGRETNLSTIQSSHL